MTGSGSYTARRTASARSGLFMPRARIAFFDSMTEWPPLLSLNDLVAANVDFLTHTVGGLFEDEHLNRVRLGLHPAERAVVYAHAEGTTWTEAVALAGASDPKVFGERVRRKAYWLAAEQHRRSQQAHPRPAPGPATSRPTGRARMPVPADAKLRRSAKRRCSDRGVLREPEVIQNHISPRRSRRELAELTMLLGRPNS